MTSSNIYFKVVVPEHSAPPDGFELLAPGASIAVRPTWLEDLVSLVTIYRDRQNKKAAKKGKKMKTNFSGEIIKKLMDGFFYPEELAVSGGTSAFAGNAIFESIKRKLNTQLFILHGFFPRK